MHFKYNPFNQFWIRYEWNFKNSIHTHPSRSVQNRMARGQKQSYISNQRLLQWIVRLIKKENNLYSKLKNKIKFCCLNIYSSTGHIQDLRKGTCHIKKVNTKYFFIQSFFKSMNSISIEKHPVELQNMIYLHF